MIFIIFCRIYGFVVTILIFIPQALNLWKANHKSEKEINTQRNVSALHEYMRDKNISLDLIIKIERYFKLNCETENNFLNSLPEKLKDEVIIEINGQILKNFAAISENFSKDFLKEKSFNLPLLFQSLKKQKMSGNFSFMCFVVDSPKFVIKTFLIKETSRFCFENSPISQANPSGTSNKHI